MKQSSFTEGEGNDDEICDTIYKASIGELGLEFAIPAGNRYLWDFATLPAWRGIRIYPRLLHVIVNRESIEAERFWIGHVDGNSASGRGIVKAGYAEAVRQLGENAALRRCLGEHGREKVARSFGYDQLAGGLLAVYERLLSRM
jgi:glycosyltransferase involved in cell wall biosynthesis